MNRALFLDRDGVINVERGTFTWRIEDFQLMPGILELCAHAHNLEFMLIVITNQSGIARELYTHEDVRTLHDHMQALFSGQSTPLDGVYYCPHHPSHTGDCFCRKPGSLMLERAIARFDISASDSFMLGDKQRDLDAGKAVGCQTVFVGEDPKGIVTDFVVRRLEEVMHFLG